MPSVTTESKPGLSGTCDARFAKLRDLFEVMLNDGREVGAAVALYADGKPVVDLWGGWADPDARLPWQRDTIVSTFSVSKALVSTMGHMLIDRGEIDLDTPVARYWPEFGQNESEATAGGSGARRAVGCGAGGPQENRHRADHDQAGGSTVQRIHEG